MDSQYQTSTNTSHQAYLMAEAAADYKSEFFEGQVVAMAGTSLNHKRIARNICLILETALHRKSCETFIGDVRLRVEKKDMTTYPDVMVLCEPPEFYAQRKDTVLNPTLIVEVLSKSTEKYDRRDKFYAYWALPSLCEYILVDQYSMCIEYFQPKRDKVWELLVLTSPDEVLELLNGQVKAALGEIYRGVIWDEEDEGQSRL